MNVFDRVDEGGHFAQDSTEAALEVFYIREVVEATRSPLLAERYEEVREGMIPDDFREPCFS